MTAKERSRARRQFLLEASRMVCGVGALGFVLGLHARQARARPPLAIRPPGAIAEADFLGACIRCGLCVRDCPYDILRLASPDDAPANGTPYFTARDKPCEMCQDIPCVKACPTGALDHDLTDINKARMGLAVLVDQETCLCFLGLRCEVCYNNCPVFDQALTLELRPNPRTGHHAEFIPVVHSEQCTGCGKCEKSCPLEVAAIKVYPMELAKGQLGAHYELGWIEKQKAGASLVTPDPEHHYNLPPGVRYELGGRGLVEPDSAAPGAAAPEPPASAPLHIPRALQGDHPL